MLTADNMMLLAPPGDGAGALQWAWIIYFAGAAVAGLLALIAKGRARWLPLALMVCAFLLHTLGLAARAIAAGRAPLGDMYESVVFAAWGAALLGLIAVPAFRRTAPAWAGALIAGGGILVAKILPGGSALQAVPLAVRSDFWLTVHVAIILLGFGAFALAAGLAHYAWGVYCFRPSNETLFSSLASVIHRLIKVGVVFFVAGTVMGGFWAAQAWGRFWGWDSKESWALITILVYMMVLHARSCGWLGEFGVVLSAMGGFLAVLMTWYGANFLLGVGLHSYGFGRGGDMVALLIFAAEILLILSAGTLRTSRIADALRAGKFPPTTESTESSKKS
jgi:ABC-type transport system involved in cytochrome c biogenesis permease subunit